MSTELSRPAYATRLGNLPAKSVLVLLADQVNAEGFGWPSVDFIVRSTEINKRTVLRVIQVFMAIDLLAKIDRGARRTPGLQLNLAKLGGDLKAEFARAYAEAQGNALKPARGECLTDTGRGVSQTLQSVSQTLQSVSQTLPPHPLLGGPVKDPLMTQPPDPPLAGDRCFEKEHDDACTTKSGSTSVAAQVERGEVLAGEFRQAQLRIQAGSCAKDDLNSYSPGDSMLAAALDQVMTGLGCRKPRSRKRIRAVIEAECALTGSPPAEIAADIIAAWEEQARVGHLLFRRFSALEMIELGMWKQRNQWHWDKQALRERQASAGSFQ